MRKADEFWRPISSAPRDGSAILLYVPHSGETPEDWIGIGFFERPDDLGEGGYWKGENPTVSAVGATHWAPRPEPPAALGSPAHRGPPKAALWRVAAGAAIFLSLTSAVAWRAATVSARRAAPRFKIRDTK